MSDRLIWLSKKLRASGPKYMNICCLEAYEIAEGLIESLGKVETLETKLEACNSLLEYDDSVMIDDVSKIKELEAKVKDLEADARNWREDFSHENGNYIRNCFECSNEFIGHKRRSFCRLCETTTNKG